MGAPQAPELQSSRGARDTLNEHLRPRSPPSSAVLAPLAIEVCAPKPAPERVSPPRAAQEPPLPYLTRPSSAAAASRVPVKSHSMLHTSPPCTKGSAAASAAACTPLKVTRHTTTRVLLDTASSSHGRPAAHALVRHHAQAQESNAPSFRAHDTPEAAPPGNVQAPFHRRSSESNAQTRAGAPATPTASASGRPGPCKHQANEVHAAPASNLPCGVRAQRQSSAQHAHNLTCSSQLAPVRSAHSYSRTTPSAPAAAISSP